MLIIILLMISIISCKTTQTTKEIVIPKFDCHIDRPELQTIPDDANIDTVLSVSFYNINNLVYYIDCLESIIDSMNGYYDTILKLHLQ